jgi:uncharacterized protein YndB with AHSA1/START domain
MDLMNGNESVPSVRKHVDVQAPPDDAFVRFTVRPAEWWPEDHVLVKARDAIVFEPWPGGRWYERAVDGSESDWGRVLSWEPPRRILLSWRIDGDFRPIDNDERASRIEVTFTPSANGVTRVQVAHIELDRHGPAAQRIHAAIDGPSPGETLSRFASALA